MFKVAILSDIHGNLPALQAVVADIDAWRPDHVIVNGDVVNRGPRPADCWALVMARVQADGWQMTLGNHEEYTLEWDAPRPQLSAVEREMYRTSLWTYQQLDAAAIAAMRRLPLALTLRAPDGTQLRAQHASLRNTSDGVGPWTTDAELRAKIAPAPDVFVTSHTHRLLQRRIDDTLVVNSGSVGCPLDDDVRAGYARVVWDGGWSAELVRVAYDRAVTQRDFEQVRYVEIAGASALLLYREWRDAHSHFPVWARLYNDRVQSGRMTPTEAITAYLTLYDAGLPV